MNSVKEAMTREPSVVIRAVTRTRSWLSVQRGLWLDYVAIFGVFAVVYVAIAKFNSLYYHDSAHYLARALWYSGMSRQDAFDIVYKMHVANGWEPTTTIQGLFDWGLVAPRVVLPFISVPFIWAFGTIGLAVTTGIITFLLIFSLYKFLSRRYGRAAAVVTVVLMQSSFLIMVFCVGMLTESLSALWGVATLAAAFRYQRDPRLRWVVVMVAVTVLSAFTRQATLIVAGAFVVAWMMSRLALRPARWGIPALVVAGTSVMTQVIQTWLFPFSQGDQYMRMTGTDSLWGAVRATPSLAKHIFLQELTSYAKQDQALLVLIGLAVISMLVFWRRTESHLLLGALLATALYTITNGNSTDFRYAVPGVVFFLASIALLVANLMARAGSADGVAAEPFNAPATAAV